jgi:PiT family inorganic phosphate transporter
MEDVTTLGLIGLGFALLLAFGFEFVNGFHDTANAVATVIYTRTLPATPAVIWSGLMNLTGVLVSSGAVAFGIVALLPVELVIHAGSGAGYAMVFAMLVSAIIWNVGTWWRGLPASSSHTLIGAILGVGLMNSLLTPGHVFGDGVNWGKVKDTVLALLISPLIGFVVAGALLLLAKLLIKYPALFKEPPEGQPPPWPVRALLILTCTGVSFAHGSNDGQKGMGLIMLILVGVLPGIYAVNVGLSGKPVQQILSSNKVVAAIIEKRQQPSTGGVQTASAASNTPIVIAAISPVAGLQVAATSPVTSIEAAASPAKDDANEQTISDYLKSTGKLDAKVFAALAAKNAEILRLLDGKTAISELPKADRKPLRTDTYLVSSALDKMTSSKVFSGADLDAVKSYRKSLDKLTKFIPTWVKIAIALALGLGTMIGYKRIVVTVGSKIGKAHLTYGQGASAEVVAYATIQGADLLGLPVSTTHILSSGVAGTMAANRSGLQRKTLRDILLAWVLTLPVCVFMGSMLFAAGLLLVARLGIK